jgi:hypothetical protein
VVVDKPIYFASEDDLDTVIFFLAFHETSDLLRKKQYPDIDLLLSMQPSQSAYEYPKICIFEVLGNRKPLPGLCLRYLTTMQAAQ